MNKLKELRKQKGFTQKEIAEAIKVAPTTYLGYEKGNISIDDKMLIQLADFFNISIDELLERDTEIVNLKYLDETRKKLIKEILEMNDNAVARLDAFYEGLKLAERDRQEIMKRLKGGKND